MSRTYRAPPPRRRLRAGYASRLCWRCRYPVAACSCPARALVVHREQPEGDLSDEASGPDWRACWDYREWTDDHDNTPPLTQPLGLKLVEAQTTPEGRAEMIDRYNRTLRDAELVRRMLAEREAEDEARFDAFLASLLAA